MWAGLLGWEGGTGGVTGGGTVGRTNGPGRDRQPARWLRFRPSRTRGVHHRPRRSAMCPRDALTPPHHLAGYIMTGPREEGGVAPDFTQHHKKPRNNDLRDGRRGRERKRGPAFRRPCPLSCSRVPSAQQQLPASQPALSRPNAQRGNPNTKVRMDGRAAFPCDCGPTREGMHTAHPTRVSACIKGTVGPQSQGGRKSRRRSDRLKFRGEGGGQGTMEVPTRREEEGQTPICFVDRPQPPFLLVLPRVPAGILAPVLARSKTCPPTPKKDRQLRIA